MKKINFMWEKAFNGYYYCIVDKDHFYTIEVTRNYRTEELKYSSTINFKDGEYGYLSGSSHKNLDDAKKECENHFIKDCIYEYEIEESKNRKLP